MGSDKRERLEKIKKETIAAAYQVERGLCWSKQDTWGHFTEFIKGLESLFDFVEELIEPTPVIYTISDSRDIPASVYLKQIERAECDAWNDED